METTTRFTDELSRHKDALTQSAAPWLWQLREDALARIAPSGFPAQRNEEWLYTNIQPLLRTYPAIAPDAPAVSTDHASGHWIPELEGPRLLFVDGHFQPAASAIGTLPAGLTVERVSDAIERGDDDLKTRLSAPAASTQEDAFRNLNAALFGDGVVVRVAADCKVDVPVQILHLSSGRSAEESASYLRNFIVAEAGSGATVVEVFASMTTDTATVSNRNLAVEIGERAHLEHYHFWRESSGSHHLSFQQAVQEGNSHYATWFFGFGEGLARNEIHLRVTGENASSLLNGLYVGRHESHVDNHTLIDHEVSNCHSREIYKGVLAEKSRGIFSGKIHVHPHAQKTDAEQSNDALILSRSATANTRPRLEIYADDVK